MKNLKKLASLLLALVMVFALATTAYAAGNGSITIENAAKGETYKIVKVFDAELGANNAIVYKTNGDLPTELAAVFTKDANGYITRVEGKTDAEVTAAVAGWAAKQNATAQQTATGGALTFSNLEYGYYAVLSSQGAVVSIDTTNPSATIYDKNTKTPTASKTVDDDNVAIGDTVTYTATFDTANWLGEGKDSKQVVKYEISDTLPDFLTEVKVTSITVGGTEITDKATTTDGMPSADWQFGTDKKITIPWVDENGNSLYNNGAKIVVTYTAKVTDKAVIDGAGNENAVTLQPYTKNPGKPNEPDPWKDTYTSKEVVYTYAAALKKVDENKKPLAGAKFAANGLTVTGSKGNYTVVSYDSTSTTQGTVMETDDEGNLVIKGLPSDITVSLTETQAPAGYNKVTTAITLTPTKISETVTVTSTTKYYDADGNELTEQTETSTSKTTITYNENLKKTAVEVVNKTGSLLPSTGGMGTTLFYVIGGLLTLGAAVLLITKRRMNAR